MKSAFSFQKRRVFIVLVKERGDTNNRRSSKLENDSNGTDIDNKQITPNRELSGVLNSHFRLAF